MAPAKEKCELVDEKSAGPFGKIRKQMLFV
jgi:hypothetical protein